MKNKKGLEMAISTIILLILGIIILIGLITMLIMGWSNFKMNIGAILGSEIAQAQKMCEIQCSLENNYDYCCGEKIIKGTNYTCEDSLMKTNCILDCSEVKC